MVGPAPSPQCCPSFLVLIVDDNAINRKVLAVPLRKHGFEVLEAQDGLEAVQSYALFRPAVVLMDISMPIMDGFEATRQIRMLGDKHLDHCHRCHPCAKVCGNVVTEKRIESVAIPKKTRIIATTTHNDERDIEKGKQAGMDDWLIKPIELSVLLHDVLEFERQFVQESVAMPAVTDIARVGLTAAEAAVGIVLQRTEILDPCGEREVASER